MWGRRKGKHRLGSSKWERRRFECLSRDNWLCQPCLARGHLTTAVEVDHKIPHWKGGTDDLDNLQAICKDCHIDKTLIESAEASGKTLRRKPETGLDGWPIRGEGPVGGHSK